MEAKGLDALMGCQGSDQELKRTLKTLDDLLAKLPKEEIERFSKTKDFEIYKRVLKRYGVE